MACEPERVDHENFEAEKVYRQLDSGEIVWLIAIKADNSVVFYDTLDNPFVKKESGAVEHDKDLLFILEGGHCGSMRYSGAIKQCKWKRNNGDLTCRRTINSWSTDEGCS